MINTGITLNNNMSGTINKIIGNLNDLISTSQNAKSALNGMFDGIETPSMNMASQLDVTEEIQRNTNEQMDFNNEVQKTSEFASKAKGVIAGMVGAYAGIQGIKKFVGTSDELTLMNARINNIKSDSESLAEVQEKIFASSQRARGDYMMTMDTIGKLGSQAGEAFSGTDEIIAFAEQLNKHFVLSGASIEGASAAQYQLNQAMAMGVLRGEEFNSIRENAPSVVQAIADYMGVAKGEVKALADEGQLSADIVKNALLSSAELTNEAFGEIPMTFAQIKQATMNTFVQTLQPSLERFNQFLNTENFGNFVSNVSTVMNALANVVGVTVELVINGFNFVAENIGIIQGPLLGLIAVWTMYNAILSYNTFVASANAKITALLAGEKVTLSFAQQMYAIATGQATAAQVGLNAAILASPVFWIPALIIGVISLIYGVVGAINKVKGTTISATGIIVGVISSAVAFLINRFIMFGNNVITVAENGINTFRRFGEFLGNFANHPLQATLRVFERFAQNALNIIRNLASAIDSVFGSNLGSVVSSWQSGLSSKVDSLLSNDYNKTADIKLNRIETIAIKDAYSWGYNKGSNLADGVSGFISGKLNPQSSLPDLPKQAELLQNVADIPKAVSEPTKGLAKDMGKVKDNTKEIKDALNDKIEFKNEDLAYLRELATSRAITQYSLDKVMVEVKNEFGDVNENVDLDGWQNSLVDGLIEAVETGIGGMGNAPA